MITMTWDVLKENKILKMRTSKAKLANSIDWIIDFTLSKPSSPKVHKRIFELLLISF